MTVENYISIDNLFCKAVCVLLFSKRAAWHPKIFADLFGNMSRQKRAWIIGLLGYLLQAERRIRSHSMDRLRFHVPAIDRVRTVCTVYGWVLYCTHETCKGHFNICPCRRLYTGHLKFVPMDISCPNNWHPDIFPRTFCFNTFGFQIFSPDIWPSDILRTITRCMDWAKEQLLGSNSLDDPFISWSKTFYFLRTK